jgi:hypothetical protein
VPGTYEIRWWLNNDLQLIAKSPAITVQSAATVTVPATANSGDAVSVAFANGPGNPGDWWGVYLVGAPDGRYLSWGYLNGQQTMPATGLTGATLSIPMPMTPGTYEIRWWANNGLTPIGKSGPIIVVSTTAAAIEPSIALPGEVADAAAQLEVVDQGRRERLAESHPQLVVRGMTEVSLQAGEIVEVDDREVVGRIGSDRFVSGAVRHALAEPYAAYSGNLPDRAIERCRERAPIVAG